MSYLLLSVCVECVAWMPDSCLKRFDITHLSKAVTHQSTWTYARYNDRVTGRPRPQWCVKELPSCSITSPHPHLLHPLSSFCSYPPLGSHSLHIHSGRLFFSGFYFLHLFSHSPHHRGLHPARCGLRRADKACLGYRKSQRGRNKTLLPGFKSARCHLSTARQRLLWDTLRGCLGWWW